KGREAGGRGRRAQSAPTCGDGQTNWNAPRNGYPREARTFGDEKYLLRAAVVDDHWFCAGGKIGDPVMIVKCDRGRTGMGDYLALAARGFAAASFSCTCTNSL